MLTPFEKLSDQSRIWIYQSKTELDQTTQQNLLADTEQFLNQWAAHGEALLASATIEFNRFLIIAIDENFNMASGCSIDSMVRQVQNLGESHGVDFFDRTQLAFKKGDRIELMDMKEINQQVTQGFFDSETLYFNNNIQSKSQLKDQWLIRPEESWLKRYFQTAKSV
ncbi:hypothetical protein [Roseivirga sp.]|uniref:hypothetical protein n=1 Tax=Roseivirga sp. TaxID=1964215 RepID=UPI003B515821